MPSLTPQKETACQNHTRSSKRLLLGLGLIHADGSLGSDDTGQQLLAQLVSRRSHHVTSSLQSTSATRSFSSPLQTEISSGGGDVNAGGSPQLKRLCENWVAIRDRARAARASSGPCEHGPGIIDKKTDRREVGQLRSQSVPSTSSLHLLLVEDIALSKCTDFGPAIQGIFHYRYCAHDISLSRRSQKRHCCRCTTIF